MPRHQAQAKKAQHRSEQILVCLQDADSHLDAQVPELDALVEALPVWPDDRPQ
jgi:hypothetical protein